jgi:hypothetical protein
MRFATCNGEASFSAISFLKEHEADFDILSFLRPLEHKVISTVTRGLRFSRNF